MTNSACGHGEFQEILRFYGNGDSVGAADDRKESDDDAINISSRMEYWDEPYGQSELSYNFAEKLTETHAEEYETLDIDED